MQNYECKTCGAVLYWNTKSNSLKCEYCDSEFDISEFEDNSKKATQEAPKVDLTYTTTGEDIAEDMTVLKCDNCGAEVVTSKTTMATECAYCGQALSVSHNTAGDFRPEKIIPFKIDKKQAKETYFKYAKSSFLTPKEFQDINIIDKMQGIYVPYNLHSLDTFVDSELTCRNITSERVGNDKVTTTKTYEVKVKAEGRFDSIPINASKQMDVVTMEAIEPYDFNNIKEFNPAYMAGYFAEQPDKNHDDTTVKARQRAKDAMKEKILETADSFEDFETKTFIRYDDEFENEMHEYAMMPVWLCNVTYKNQKYTFLINGESGKIIGKLPLNKAKLAGVIGGVFAIAQIALTLFSGLL